MANVSIKFNNKEFLLSCDDGQEEHLEELLIHINQKFNDLKNNLGNLGENKLLLITAVKIMDEYYETKKKVDQKKNELKDLSNKFRELKSLIYDYRDKKDQEINELNTNHLNFKNEIEANHKKYEQLIDDAADEISNFIEKAKLENILEYSKKFNRDADFVTADGGFDFSSNELLDSEISASEVLSAIRSLKSGKACGDDGILNEMINGLLYII